MSRAKNRERTYLWRHRQDIVKTILGIGPGEVKEFFFETLADAERFRGRLYSFVPAYYGYQKFVISRDDTTIKVINLAGEIYDRKKDRDERGSALRGNERENRDEGGERE